MKVTSFFLFLLFSTTLLADDSCRQLSQGRADFLKHYKQKNYDFAYNTLAPLLTTQSSFSSCRNEEYWAHSDMVLAALKLKDAAKCFKGASELIANISDDVYLQSKALKALYYNYNQCVVSLPEGEKQADDVYCNFNGLPCMDFKTLVIAEKFKEPKGLSRALCDGEKRALSLEPLGQEGCLSLSDFKIPEDYDDENATCPDVLWQNGSNNDIFNFQKNKKHHNFLSDPSSCCNSSISGLSKEKKSGKIFLYISSGGRDCYGGTGRDISENKYLLDFETKTIEVIESKRMGLH